jgi:type IV pilus assembly protein PilB
VRRSGRDLVQDTVVQRLLEAKLVNPQQIADAERLQKTGGGSVSSNLVKLGAIAEKEFNDFLSKFYGVPFIDIAAQDVDPAVVRLIPADVANKFQVVPLKRNGRHLTVVMANPSNIFAIDDIKFITGCEVETRVASETSIKKAIDRFYDSAGSLSDLMKEFHEDVELVEATEDETGGVNLGEITGEEAPVVKLVNSLLADAIRKGASDIHVEPFEKSVRVRFRIDGELYEMMSPPVRMKLAMLSRLKIMAELDIAERRVPQDGRIRLRMFNKNIDLRVSSLPTIFGEKIVMRILDKSNLNIDLTKLGFDPVAFKKLNRAIEMPFGMVLVTGPTGSGKTTTLYSALTRVNKTGVNIMTAEDPVEYNLEGINQVNVNDEVGLTFATALRAFLRQDPNIIMVGEIRDIETASIGVKAALTGHLVLSTLHTNDAPSTLNRLIDMGVEPFLVGSSVNLIMAQRLLRRVCNPCKKMAPIHHEVAEELGFTAEEAKSIQLAEGQGCVECNNTGYKGRQGVYEVMPITPAIRELILERAPTSEIKKVAVSEGMLTLRAHALVKLKEGLTSSEEVLKETSKDD